MATPICRYVLDRIGLRVLVLFLCALFQAAPVAMGAATVEVLQNFSVPGAQPQGGLVADAEGNLYGTTQGGGVYLAGVVFKVTPSGKMTVLHQFGSKSNGRSRLYLASNGWLYGTAVQGGTEGKGTLYRVSKAGEFQTLHHFASSGCSAPKGALIEVEAGVFYGTTEGGGLNQTGTVFKYTADAGVTILHSFESGTAGELPSAVLDGTLVLGGDGKLYGASRRTLFRIATTGEFETLYTFPYEPTQSLRYPLGTNLKGPLTLASDGNFYGVTTSGGTNSQGTFFRLRTNGLVDILHHFPSAFMVRGDLVEGSDGFLYGTTYHPGVLFRISKQGVIETLHQFIYEDGISPPAGVTRVGDDFYGVTAGGGIDYAGTLFKYSAQGGFHTVYSFGTGDGHRSPSHLHAASDGKLYATVDQGGGLGHGAILRVTPGEGAEIWHSFTEVPPQTLDSRDRAHRMGAIEGSDGAFYCITDGVYHPELTTISKVSPDGTATVLRSIGPPYELLPRTAFVRGKDGHLYCSAAHSSAGIVKSVIVRLEGSGEFATVHTFSQLDGYGNSEIPFIAGSDGALYGTTAFGGAHGKGSVFRLAPDGTFTKLYDFTEEDGKPSQYQSLAEGADGAFYGATYVNNILRFFRITPQGEFSVLREITRATLGEQLSALVQARDGNFYGVMSSKVVRVTPNGELSTLHTLSGVSDFGLEQGADGNLYGLTASGGGQLFRVVITASAPVAQDDVAAVRPGEAVTIPVLGNDSDEDQQPLTITGVTQGVTGTVQIVEGGVRYTASRKFSGADSFTYTISDGYGSATATVHVRNPFISEQGSFVTTLLDEDGKPAGTLTLNVNRLGAVTGVILLNGGRTKFKGTLGLNGTLSATLPCGKRSPLNLQVTLDLRVSPSVLIATLREEPTGLPPVEFHSVSITAQSRSLADGVSAGNRTLRFIVPEGDNLPKGYGWATVKTERSGMVRLAGKLGDGSPFTAGVRMQRDGTALLRLSLPRNSGEIFGLLDLSSEGDATPQGTFFWRKPERSKGTYRAGFETEVSAYLAPFEKPKRGERVFTYPNPETAVLGIQFSDGGLQPIEGELKVSLTDKTSPASPADAGIRLTINRANGTFRGALRLTGQKPLEFTGILDQSAGGGFGLFTNGEVTGSVMLTAQ